MSDLSAASYYNDNKKDNGISPMLLILLLCLCGGDNGGLFGGSCDKNGSCGGSCGLDGILPIILLLSLMGGF